MFCTRGSLSFLPELKLRKIFPAVYFVNTNLPEGRTQVLISGNKLSPLPDNSLLFSISKVLVAIWKGQMQHFAIENMAL